jgi:uncharacterized protein YndB with AHSA1/START domain
MSGATNIERQIFIAASPETVFRFFVEPAFTARWFGQQHTLDPRPGGIFRVQVSARQLRSWNLYGGQTASPYRLHVGMGGPG